jgi:hypothetical protein
MPIELSEIPQYEPMGNALTVPDIRAIMRFRGRNADTSVMYADRQLDFAFRKAANMFIRATRFTKEALSLPLLAGEDTLTAFPAGFHPDRILAVYLTGANVVATPISAGRFPSPITPQDTLCSLRRGDYAEVLTMATASPSSGQPVVIAFKSITEAKLYPKALKDVTVNFLWTPPCTSWQAGAAFARANVAGGAITSVDVLYPFDAENNVSSSGSIYSTEPTIAFSGGGGVGALATATIDADENGVSDITVDNGGTGYTSAPVVVIGGQRSDVTINLPDDVIEQIASDGAIACLQETEEEHTYAREAMARFQAYIRSQVGRGTLGGRLRFGQTRTWFG